MHVQHRCNLAGFETRNSLCKRVPAGRGAFGRLCTEEAKGIRFRIGLQFAHISGPATPVEFLPKLPRHFRIGPPIPPRCQLGIMNENQRNIFASFAQGRRGQLGSRKAEIKISTKPWICRRLVLVVVMTRISNGVDDGLHRGPGAVSSARSAG